MIISVLHIIELKNNMTGNAEKVIVIKEQLLRFIFNRKYFRLCKNNSK